MMGQSCKWCAYVDNRTSDNCHECSRNFVDRFTPTFTSTKLHTYYLDNSSADLIIAHNQAGPGYYVGDQTDPDRLEWVSTLQEASKVFVDMVRQWDRES